MSIRSELGWSTRERIVVRGKDLPGEILGSLNLGDMAFVELTGKVPDEKQRLFYMQKTIENGWSRNILLHQIESKLYLRQGNAITNFSATLPPLQSDLARETLKNPYVFDFIGLGEEMQERELEKALIQHMKKFMLELGKGFAYVGNQYNLNVAGDDFFLDLLFFNYHLDCFVVF